MKVFDEAELVFDLKNVPATTNYDIVLRYEPQVSSTLLYKNCTLLIVYWTIVLSSKVNYL